MRLLHFSDLHLGVENYGSLDARTGLSTRVLDFLNVFDQIVERAISGGFDAVLFSGDAFKNRDPSPTLQREFARRIQRLAAGNIPIVIVIGNHDLPNVITRATPVEIYQILAIPGVYVCRSIERIDIQTKSGTLQVVALPWVTRSLLLSAEQYRDMGDIDLDREMAALVAQSVQSLQEQLSAQLPAVLVAHVSLQGATLGFEQSIMLGRDVTVGLDDLQARGFDYIALGHIHKHQQLGTAPPAMYAGSPERIDFGEEHEVKGYVEVTIATNERGERVVTPEFVPLATRPFRTIRVDALGDDPMVTVRRDLELEAPRLAGAIVRCFVEVEPGRERAVNVPEIRRALLDAGAAYVAHVIVESTTVSRAREAIGEDQARDSLRMLQLWVERQSYDDALKERVLVRGRDLIAGHQLASRRERNSG